MFYFQGGQGEGERYYLLKAAETTKHIIEELRKPVRGEPSREQLRMETYLPHLAHDCCVVESPAASLKPPQIKEARGASFDLAKVNAVLRELEPQTIPRCG